MRLRAALQDVVLRSGAARRQAQLGAVRSLERELLALAGGLDRRELTTVAALRVVIDRFALAAGAIGPADIAELLGGGDTQSEHHAATILTARHGCHAA